MFFRFLSFFCVWNSFETVFLWHFEKMKKTCFFDKTCRFYTYFETAFWLQHGALENDIPSFECNLYDFYWYKSVFLLLKHIFFKSWTNNTHVTHFFALRHFAKMDILQKFRSSNFYFIFVASDFFNIFSSIFLAKMFEVFENLTIFFKTKNWAF